jgi:chromosome condensin MukBEF complex kleisin-like MukF subunit
MTIFNGIEIDLLKINDYIIEKKMINFIKKLIEKLNKKLKNIVEYNYTHLTKEMTVEDGSDLKLYKPSEFDFKL